MRGSAWGSLRRLLGVGATGLVFQLLPLLPPVPETPGEVGPKPARIVGVRAVSSGDHSERIQVVPITRYRQVGERSAISLDPEELGPLYRDSQLRVSSELQVSTTCVEPLPRCRGRRYSFNPKVATRLVLASRPDATSGHLTRPLTPWRGVKCHQQRPNRNHHCVLVIPPTPASIGKTGKLPCKPKYCFVNLVVRAHHPRARHGSVMVVGGDSHGGRVIQDKGRVNAVVVHRWLQAGIENISASTPGGRRLEIRSRKREVVHSVELSQPQKGERLEVLGSFIASLHRLPYNALISSYLIVAPRPSAIEPGLARRVVSMKGKLSEKNGFNCTRGPSGYSSPCRTIKVGAATIVRDPTRVLGPGVPLYVNLVARAKPLLHTAKGHHRVKVRRGGLAVTRYMPIGEEPAARGNRRTLP